MKSLLLTVVMALAFSSACIHKASGPVSAKERAATFNAVFAETDSTIEQGAEAAASSGLLTNAQAQPIIAFTGQAASLHKQVTAILGQATITAGDLASIQALLLEIKAQGDAAIASGAMGVKNPKSQAKFSDDLNSLYSAADAIISAIQQVAVSQVAP